MAKPRPLPNVFCFVARSTDRSAADHAARIVRSTLRTLGLKVEGPDAFARTVPWRDPSNPFGPFVEHHVHFMRLRVEGTHEDLEPVLASVMLPGTVVAEISAFDHRQTKCAASAPREGLAAVRSKSMP